MSEIKTDAIYAAFRSNYPEIVREAEQQMRAIVDELAALRARVAQGEADSKRLDWVAGHYVRFSSGASFGGGRPATAWYEVHWEHFPNDDRPYEERQSRVDGPYPENDSNSMRAALDKAMREDAALYASPTPESSHA